MGKGDKKSKRGKILMGSYGVRRRRKKVVHEPLVKALIEELPVKAKKEKPATKPKTEAEEAVVGAPVAEVPGEVAEKPARKKSAPKPKASKKEDQQE
jgi:30S ribosomal protein S31